jgi:ribonucleotide reductase alpha subunit
MFKNKNSIIIKYFESNNDYNIKLKNTLKLFGLDCFIKSNEININIFNINVKKIFYKKFKTISKFYNIINNNNKIYNDEETKITLIKKLKNKEDTYCFNEPEKNRGIFNGLMLGNCSEITLATNKNHTSVCNLASICLGKFVEDKYTKEELNIPENERRVLNNEFPINPVFNYKLLSEISGELTENLNNVINKNWVPVVEAVRTNYKNRPIGIGIQGLTDVFMKFKVPFESEEAQILNKNIAEAIYFGALSKSTEISRIIYFDLVNQLKSTNEIHYSLYSENVLKQFPILNHENVIQTFNNIKNIPKDIGSYYEYNKNEGAPIKNKFHWEYYGLENKDLSGMFDWEGLREHINIYGVRNSTLIAYMPTASTSQIMGGIPCFEPYHSNLYKRKTLAGHFVIINKYLINDLINNNLWNEDMKNYLLKNDGSIQNIEGLDEDFKNLYKTIWDIKQKNLIKLSADRQPFIDQSQSLNLYFKNYNTKICANVMMYAWKSKLKTGSYYLNVTPALEAQKFTIDDYNNKKFSINKKNTNNLYIDINEINEDDEDDKICLLCSS